MRIEENAGGGDTVILEPGDDPAQVPETHRGLLSPMIRDVFVDPVSHFRDIASRSRFTSLSQWINALIADPKWELELNRGFPFDERVNWTMTGFRWNSDSVAGALIGLPTRRDFHGYPKSLADYYKLVDVVHCTIFGGAGGLYGADDHTSISEFLHDLRDADLCPEDVFVFGSSGCGDMMIYSVDDRGGWLCHENGHIHWLGSITDTVNWMFGELLKNREPEYDYSWR